MWGEEMELTELQSAIEGILFAAGDPVGVERLCMSLETNRASIDKAAKTLMDYYSFQRRGIRLIKLGTSYQLCSAPEHAVVIRKTFESRKPAKLSPPALEVLSIVAYYQPTTRAYVDQVRGIDSSYTISLLLDRELIEECGRLAVPGRPILYRTTQNFLRTFSISNLEELPELPSTSPEDGQVAVEMQSAIEKLRAQNEAEELEGEAEAEANTTEVAVEACDQNDNSAELVPPDELASSIVHSGDEPGETVVEE